MADLSEVNPNSAEPESDQRMVPEPPTDMDKNSIQGKHSFDTIILIQLTGDGRFC